MKGETTYLTSHFDCISHIFIHRWTIVDPENYERHIIESYFIFNRRNVTNVIFNLWTIVMRRYHHTNWIHLNQMTSNWKRRKKIDILFFNTFESGWEIQYFYSSLCGWPMCVIKKFNELSSLWEIEFIFFSCRFYVHWNRLMEFVAFVGMPSNTNWMDNEKSHAFILS